MDLYIFQPDELDLNNLEITIPLIWALVQGIDLNCGFLKMSKMDLGSFRN